MTRLTYRRQGEGPPLVLVHGYLGGSDMWRAEIDVFSDRFDVVAPDLAGFGASAHLTAPDSIDGHARQVFALLDDLGVERFHLLGHSMGGMIVQQMAALKPARITKLVCYGTGPRGVLPDRFETIEESRRRLTSDGLSATARRIAATWFVEGEQAAGYQRCVEVGAKATLQAALASLDAWEGWDGRAALGEIACPTLVVWGERDRSYGWSQPEALLRGIPDASLALMPGRGHNAHMEEPELFHRLVGDFLSSQPAGVEMGGKVEAMTT